jgi:hypothetical protein
MADVYRNALVTICAMASPGSAHGIFRRRPPSPGGGRQHQPSIQLPISGPTDTSTVTVRLYNPHHDDENLFNLDLGAPLSLRAWCLQESILPRRILYFGAAQLYWGCSQGFQSADGIPGPDLFPRHGSGPPCLASALRDAEHQPSLILPFPTPHLQTILRRYHLLVSAYSRRTLTFPSDKLPAMSGLAQRVHPRVGGESVAGLWTVDFKGGLLWSRAVGGSLELGAGVKGKGTGKAVFRAPSWSWAAVDGAVQFAFGPTSSTATAKGGDGGDGGDALGHADDLVLVSHEMVLKDPAARYGEIVSGHVVVRGLTARLRRVHGAEFDEENSGDLIRANVHFDEPEWEGWRTDQDCYLGGTGASGAAGAHFLVFGDRKTTGGPMAQRDYLMLLVRRYHESHRRESLDSDEEDARGRGQCLILDGVLGGGEYRRVGVVNIVCWDKDVSAVRWEEQTLKIV